MAIHLSCPVCGTNRFKAPNRAAGKRCRCPECRSSFRLTDGMPVLEWGNVPGLSEKDSPSPAVETAEARIATVPESPPFGTVIPDPPAKQAVESPTDDRPTPSRRSPLIPRDPGDQLALAAAGLAGLGLVATAVPYGRIATVIFASLGLLVGLLGILAADRSRRWAAASVAGSVLVLAVVCLAPGWLGLRPWWETTSADDDLAGQIRAVSRAGGGVAEVAGEWVDASQSVWRQDDVDVAVSAVVGPVELAGPKGQKKWTRERYLQFAVKIGNKGVERRLSVSAWPLADGSAPRATADGTPLTVPKFESGWSPVSAPTAAGVFPGKSHTQVFVYAVPAAGDVLLTIPAAGIGTRDAATLRIPRSAFAPGGRPRR